MTVQLGDPLLRAEASGAIIDVVVRVHARVSSEVSAVALWHGEDCLIFDDQLVEGVWTLYGYQLSQEQTDVPVLVKGPEARAFRRPQMDLQAFTRVKELCAGLGGISLGAHAAGGSSLAFVEWAQIACDTLRQNHGKVIQGDLASRETRLQLQQIAPDTACVVAAGTPCQAFSVQGLGLGLKDRRSQTLFAIFQATWSLQAYGLVLECVTEIARHADAMAALHTFAAQMNFQVHQVQLDLSAQWEAKRLRWWCVMLPRALPDFHLEAWPQSQHWQTVEEVIGEWLVWPQQDERVLAWTSEEAAAHANPAYGSESRTFNMKGKSPTALHSWGNALTACFCGCRRQALLLRALEA